MLPLSTGSIPLHQSLRPISSAETFLPVYAADRLFSLPAQQRNRFLVLLSELNRWFVLSISNCMLCRQRRRVNVYFFVILPE